MANVAKLRDRARVQEQKENWREAANLYRQVLEGADVADLDVALWNRVGDLHLKLGETDRAVEAFEAAVAAYTEAGLHNNAIALCRKILRVTPSRASVYLLLGQISAAKGFLADARQNFLEYADRMRRAGDVDAAFNALKEFANLFPADTEVRQLLAEQLAAAGHGAEAIEQLRILIARAEDDGGDAGPLRDRIRAIDPDADFSALRQSASAGAHDDFHSGLDAGLLDMGFHAPAAEPTGATSPAPLEVTGNAYELGEIAPLAGLETTHIAEPEPPSAAPAPAPLAGGGLLDDFNIVPLDADFGAVAPSEGAEADDAEEDEAAEPLPLLDFAVPPAPAEPLPLLDLSSPPPASAPGADLDALRRAYDADPADVRAREALVRALDAAGRAGEADALLREALHGFTTRSRHADALAVIGELLQRCPGDGTLLQKQVEHAFRAGDRERLVPAYLQLGAFLLQSGEAAKGRAVYQRVLELDPGNATARQAIGAPAPAAAPFPPPAATAERAARGAPTAPAADEYIDLGALIMEDEQPAGGTRFVVEEREPTGDEDRDFADMLAHFRKKVSENIEVEDSSSHYDLGLAFKEMGLLDEAIAEFQVALRGGANPLATLELLGQCFVEKGQFAVASRVLERASRITGASDAELIGVLYQLGRAEEAMGRTDPALDHYERVLAVDIRFRDAARRIEALRSKAQRG